MLKERGSEVTASAITKWHSTYVSIAESQKESATPSHSCYKLQDGEHFNIDQNPYVKPALHQQSNKKKKTSKLMKVQTIVIAVA